VRVDDLDLFSFDVNHGLLLRIVLSLVETQYKIYWDTGMNYSMATAG
jgi:hypothetical protein